MVRTVVIAFTWKFAVVVADKKLVVVPCVAVIVEVPIPTIAILFPIVLATNSLELVYVKTPSPLLVGGVIMKDVFPMVLLGIEKLLNVGSPLII